MNKLKDLKWLSCLMVMLVLLIGVPVYAAEENPEIEEEYEVIEEVDKEVEDMGVTPDAKALPGGNVEINETNFPDAVFRERILKLDQDENAILDSAEIEACTELRIEGYGVSSLKGMEFLSNLQSLYCPSNQLEDLDVTQNKELVSLNCSYNYLEELDVSQNPKLESLYCYYNNLSNLDISQNPKLESLYCHENNLSNLDISQNPNLRFLDCSSNSLNDLDVSQNPNLKELDCKNNSISNLDIRQNKKLTNLICEYNKLSTLDASQNTELVSLDCNYNESLEVLDITGSTKLKALYCAFGNISALDVSQNPRLELILCEENNLSTLNVSNNPNMRTLTCGQNKIKSIIGLEKCERMIILSLADNELMTLPDLTKMSLGLLGDPDFRNNYFTEEELRSKLPAALLENSEWMESQIREQKIPDGVRVYFNANGGASDISYKTVSYDQMYGDLPIPTMKGYTFDGWYNEITGEMVTRTTLLEVEESHTLEAQWTAREYKLSFNAGGGSVKTKSKTVTYGSACGTLPTPTRAGYKFLGWYMAKTQGNKITALTKVSITSNRTAYAYWGKNSTLTFNANGGSVKTKSKTVTYGLTCGTLPTPTRSGYKFLGWYMAKTGGNKITASTKVTIKTNRTAYAHWAKNSTLTFNANGGSVKTKSKTVTYGSICGTLPTPTRSGYKFLGWYMAKTGGNKITASTKVTITKNRTAYAHWEKK